MNLRLDLSRCDWILGEHELEQMEAEVLAAHGKLQEGSGAGNDFLGWVTLPETLSSSDLGLIKEAAAAIRDQSDVLLVIGIGGSYLGAQAAIAMLTHSFHNMLPASKRSAPIVLFAGHQLSGRYLDELLEFLADKDVTVNVISKSGTTTEPAVAFRLVRRFLEHRYGRAEAAKRIIATTDADRGALRTLAEEEGYRTFTIPPDIGGRYSVLTPVGLLPIAAAGVDIDAIVAGARTAYSVCSRKNLHENPAYQYAAARNLLYRKGMMVEILASYEPALTYLAEWWKQLFGESEGKDGKGLYPASVSFTTDLHSLGQYIQDGRRHLFETVLTTADAGSTLEVNAEESDLDGLNYLAGRTLEYINAQACLGTILAHTKGGVPNLVLELADLSPQTFGSAVYFFERACAISGYILGVNPFDQPGVEEYKQQMFSLLGKP